MTIEPNIIHRIRNNDTTKEITHFVLLFVFFEYIYRETIGYLPNLHTEHYINLCFDISMFIILFNGITLLNKRIAYLSLNIILVLWAIINLGYYRVFKNFISPSAILGATNLQGLDISQIISDLYVPSDIIIICIISANLYLISRFKHKKSTFKNISTYFLTALFCFISYQFLNPIQRGIRQQSKIEFPSVKKSIGSRFQSLWYVDPNILTYEFGLARTHLYFNVISLFKTHDSLSDEDLAILRKNETNNILINENPALGGKNIVFILVESFLSSSINHTINDQRITPCVDSLVNLKETWSNLKVHPNVGVGMSSDGQFIYMTGLLPLRKELTVKNIITTEVVGFPALLRDSLGYQTAITIPTRFSVYNQSECDQKYGIDIEQTTCQETQQHYGTDKEVFDQAISLDKTLKQPFFHCILTSSTHCTYQTLGKDVQYLDIKYPASYSKEYRNYLSECRYFDTMLKQYISRLKDFGIWDNTVLIIVADHHAQAQFLKMIANTVKEDETPFIIINANINNFESVKGKINQIDIYPSLLDLCGLNPAWKGLGLSVFRPSTYEDCATDSYYLLSKKIIDNNYLKIYR